MKNKPIHTKKKQVKTGSLTNTLSEGFNMDRATLSSTMVYLIAFVLFVIIYIANSHYHVKTTRKIKDTKQDLKEIQAEYVSLKAELAKKTKASELAKGLKDKEIKELRQPPYLVEKKK